ncbi:MAG: hypothetical protein ABGW69_01935 [Nanoarchaeota archaeon]
MNKRNKKAIKKEKKKSEQYRNKGYLCKYLALLKKNYLLVIIFILFFSIIDIILRLFFPKEFIVVHYFSKLRVILFFIAFFSLITISFVIKKYKIFLIFLILSAFPNFFELLISNKISDYLYFYFFWNNISDILISLFVIVLILSIYCESTQKI